MAERICSADMGLSAPEGFGILGEDFDLLSSSHLASFYQSHFLKLPVNGIPKPVTGFAFDNDNATPSSCPSHSQTDSYIHSPSPTPSAPLHSDSQTPLSTSFQYANINSYPQVEVSNCDGSSGHALELVPLHPNHANLSNLHGTFDSSINPALKETRPPTHEFNVDNGPFSPLIYQMSHLPPSSTASAFGSAFLESLGLSSGGGLASPSIFSLNAPQFPLEALPEVRDWSATAENNVQELNQGFIHYQVLSEQKYQSNTWVSAMQQAPTISDSPPPASSISDYSDAASAAPVSPTASRESGEYVTLEVQGQEVTMVNNPLAFGFDTVTRMGIPESSENYGILNEQQMAISPEELDSILNALLDSEEATLKNNASKSQSGSDSDLKGFSGSLLSLLNEFENIGQGAQAQHQLTQEQIAMNEIAVSLQKSCASLMEPIVAKTSNSSCSIAPIKAVGGVQVQKSPVPSSNNQSQSRVIVPSFLGRLSQPQVQSQSQNAEKASSSSSSSSKSSVSLKLGVSDSLASTQSTGSHHAQSLSEAVMQAKVVDASTPETEETLYRVSKDSEGRLLLIPVHIEQVQVQQQSSPQSHTQVPYHSKAKMSRVEPRITPPRPKAQASIPISKHLQLKDAAEVEDPTWSPFSEESPLPFSTSRSRKVSLGVTTPRILGSKYEAPAAWDLDSDSDAIPKRRTSALHVSDFESESESEDDFSESDGDNWTSLKATGKNQSSSAYSRLPPNRKERKKAQNREAAARYREKKREEGDALVDDLGSLEGHNRDLRSKLDRACAELEALKACARQLLKVDPEKYLAEAKRANAAGAAAAAQNRKLALSAQKNAKSKNGSAPAPKILTLEAGKLYTRV